MMSRADQTWPDTEVTEVTDVTIVLDKVTSQEDSQDGWESIDEFLRRTR